MTKNEFADIMLKELKQWKKFISLDDELPWQTIDEETIWELIEFVEEN